MSRNVVLLACGLWVGACTNLKTREDSVAELYPEVPITKAQQRIKRDEHGQKYASLSARDLNSDGVVDLREYRLMDWAYRVTYDFDGNGLLAWSEFILSRCPIPANRNGQNSIIQTCVRASKSLFNRLDRDRDGAVSFEEAEPLARSFFDSNDLCRDGALRPDEAVCQERPRMLDQSA